ncbi:hypothetical protein HK098_004900 [Nowakowskiella sp. JEL0407]|nr:hypothetical protein HK098_004900 [Nowakowskiella sp. JEL0407]
MKTSALFAFVCLAGSLSANALCSDAVNKKTKQVAYDALTTVFAKKNISQIDNYWSDPYLQHNPIAASGVDAFKTTLVPFIVSDSFSFDVIRIFSDCDLAIIQGNYSFGVVFDMLRVKNGKLVEHWDSNIGFASPADGPKQLLNAPKPPTATTVGNKVLVEKVFFEYGLLKNDTLVPKAIASKVNIHRTPTQKNFVNFLQTEQIEYKKVRHVIADGYFVFTLSEATVASKPFAIYDLFRLSNGKIVEHWDSRRAVPDSTVSGLEIF